MAPTLVGIHVTFGLADVPPLVAVHWSIRDRIRMKPIAKKVRQKEKLSKDNIKKPLVLMSIFFIFFKFQLQQLLRLQQLRQQRTPVMNIVCDNDTILCLFCLKSVLFVQNFYSS